MIRSLFLSLVVILSFLIVPLLVPQTVAAQTNFENQACEGVNLGSGGTCSDNAFISGFKNIVNVLIFLVGSLSVLMIIIGGIRYVVSAGNDQAVSGAKNTILFAIVGVVVSIFAYAIINFVISSVN